MKKKVGAAFLVLDLWKQSVDLVEDLFAGLQGAGKEACFVVTRLGSSQHFPFKGLLAVKQRECCEH